MSTTPEHDKRIAELTFASIYPHYITKVEGKGRTKDELHDIIHWLTGFTEADLDRLVSEKATFQQFFAQATVHPNAELITGSICGYKIQDIITPLTKQARYLDKIVDELAKGKAIEKIKRTPKS